MWNTQEINLGEQKPNTKVTATFQYKGDKVIRHVQPSCGCTAIKAEDNTVKASVALRGLTVLSNSSDFMTTITVFYTDNTFDLLTIKALVTNGTTPIEI